MHINLPLSNKFIYYMLFVTLIITSNESNAFSKTQPDKCHPSVNTALSQFIIGYGSLMQEASKRETDPNVGENYPIYVSGFKRGWIEEGTLIGFGTTYLGVKQHANSRMNAVYFKLNNAKSVFEYDKREDTYCRVGVLPKDIQSPAAIKIPKGQYWIYVTPAQQNYLPSVKLPIVQSYVDIFLSGCFQLEEKFHLQHFARDCIRTTSYWSGAWVNDRVHPRTAFDDMPYVPKIDPLIANELPQYFKQIRLEG